MPITQRAEVRDAQIVPKQGCVRELGGSPGEVRQSDTAVERDKAASHLQVAGIENRRCPCGIAEEVASLVRQSLTSENGQLPNGNLGVLNSENAGGPRRVDHDPVDVAHELALDREIVRDRQDPILEQDKGTHVLERIARIGCEGDRIAPLVRVRQRNGFAQGQIVRTAHGGQRGSVRCVEFVLAHGYDVVGHAIPHSESPRFPCPETWPFLPRS